MVLGKMKYYKKLLELDLVAHACNLSKHSVKLEQKGES